MGVGQTKLEDKYHLQKVKLGQGAFGTVWRGVNKTTGETVAVKQMDKSVLPRRGVKREDIEREVSVMKEVSHENILRLYDFCEDNENISFVLEYCDGGDFGDKVKERKDHISEAETCRWMKQMLAAIEALHKKDVCHRDIKPDNFMVSKSQNGTIKLADFGLAIVCPKGKLLTEKCGTPAFMAPEQFNVKAGRGYTHSVDVWSAGITQFMLMTGGKHPFVDQRGGLDEKKLTEGGLDFGMQGVLAMFSAGAFSSACTAFCRRLVDPDKNKRVSAAAALQDPWITTTKMMVELDRASAQPAQPSLHRAKTTGDAPDAPAQQPGVQAMLQQAGFGGGWFGLFGDQNQSPNAQGDQVTEAKKQRIQALDSQIDLDKKQQAVHRENSQLKAKIETMERERNQLNLQLQQAGGKSRRGQESIRGGG
jgi:serine/threonine protein kinase